MSTVATASNQQQTSQQTPHYRPGRARVNEPYGSQYARTVGALDVDGLHVLGRPIEDCPMPETLGDAWGICAWFELGTLYIMPAVARLMGLPDDLNAVAPDGILDGPIDMGVEHPWGALHGARYRNVTPGLVASPGDEAAGVGRLAPWTNVHHRNHPRATRAAIVLPHLDQRTAWWRARTGDDLVRALRTVSRLWGTEYYWSTNATAGAIVRGSTRNTLMPCTAIIDKQVMPALTYRRPIPGQWTRPLSSHEDGSLLVVEYDTVAAHLSPIGSANLGIGEPTHIPDGGRLAVGTSGKLAPGYYLPREAPQWPSWCRPYLPPLVFADPDFPWMPEPLVTLLTKDLAVPVDIREAYVWARTGRPYDGFASRCRETRAAVMPMRDDDPSCDLAYRANAALYKSFWGYLARTSYTPPAEGSDLHTRDLLWRPDHAHTIDTLSYCNMIRRVVRIGRASGRWPLALQNDAAYYAVNDAIGDAPMGMAIGHSGGQFTVERSAFLVTVREYLGEPGFIRQYRQIATEVKK